MSLAVTLAHGLNSLDLELPAATHQQLLAYLELLVKWNRVYNLTAIRDIEQMLIKHIFDSLAVLPYLHGTYLLDVGTGAGIPGLILALAQPTGHYVLLDSQTKKIRFVKQAVIELGLNNVQTECVRVELFKTALLFDTVITRAVSSLRNFYRQTRHLHHSHLRLIAMKGSYPHAEIQELVTTPLTVECHPVSVPQLVAERHVVVMRPL